MHKGWRRSVLERGLLENILFTRELVHWRRSVPEEGAPRKHFVHKGVVHWRRYMPGPRVFSTRAAAVASLERTYLVGRMRSCDLAIVSANIRRTAVLPSVANGPLAPLSTAFWLLNVLGVA